MAESSESATNSKESFKFNDNLTLESLRKMQANFSEERGWCKYHTPRNLLLALVGEVGELSELFQWKGEVPVGLGDWTDAEREHLGEELSDVLIYLVRLSERCHIDLPTAAQRKIGLNCKKYPKDAAYGSSKKYTEYNADDKPS